MAEDLGRFGIRVENGDVIRATKSIDDMAASGAKAEKALDELQRSTKGATSAAAQSIPTYEQVRQQWVAEARAIKGATAAQVEQQRVETEAAVARIRTADAAKVAAKAAEDAAVSYGRLRGSVTSMAASMLGAVPGVTQVASVLGQMALGAGWTIGILGGIAAISYAWKKPNDDAEEQSKRARDAIASLRQEMRAAQDALGDTAVASARAQVAAAQAALRSASKVTYGATGAKTGTPTDNSAAIATAKAALDKANTDLFQALQNKTQIDNQIEAESRRSTDEQLATIIRFGVNSAQATREANKRIAEAQAELPGLIAKGNDPRRVNLLIGTVDTLTAAINHKSAAQRAGEKADRDAAKALEKFLDQADEQEVKDAAARTEAANRIATLRAEVEAQDRLFAVKKVGQGAVDQLAISLAGEAAAHELVGKATEAQIAEARRLAEIKAANIIRDREQTAGLQAAAEAQKRAARETEQRWRTMLDEMQRGISSFFEDVFTHGVASFRQLFDSIKALFFKMVAEMIAANIVRRVAGVVGGLLGGLTPAVAGAQAGGPGGATTGASAGLGGLGTQIGLATLGSAGAGFGIGYGIGSISPNRAVGALGGAAGGAAIGTAILPGLGTAVGAVAGLVGGIVGFGKAAKEAAKQARELQAALKIDFAAYKASIQGDSLGQALAQAQSQLASILKEIDNALPGKKNEAERNRQRAEAQTLEAQQEQQIRAQFAASIQAQREDLQVRLLRAQGKGSQADDLAFQLQQQREYAQAVKDGADAQTLNTLRTVQQAEAAARATEAINSLTESLSNSPAGYKGVPGARFRATTPLVPGTDSYGGFTPTAPTPPIVISGDVHITSTATNGKELLNDLARELDAASRRGGVTGAALAIRRIARGH